MSSKPWVANLKSALDEIASPLGRDKIYTDQLFKECGAKTYIGFRAVLDREIKQGGTELVLQAAEEEGISRLDLMIVRKQPSIALSELNPAV